MGLLSSSFLWGLKSLSAIHAWSKPSALRASLTMLSTVVSGVTLMRVLMPTDGLVTNISQICDARVAVRSWRGEDCRAPVKDGAGNDDKSHVAAAARASVARTGRRKAMAPVGTAGVAEGTRKPPC